MWLREEVKKIERKMVTKNEQGKEVIPFIPEISALEPYYTLFSTKNQTIFEAKFAE
jgi:hypothetical protein